MFSHHSRSASTQLNIDGIVTCVDDVGLMYDQFDRLFPCNVYDDG